MFKNNAVKVFSFKLKDVKSQSSEKIPAQGYKSLQESHSINSEGMYTTQTRNDKLQVSVTTEPENGHANIVTLSCMNYDSHNQEFFLSIFMHL